ncbi:SDR family NAD(P)-dependent oxidoreductase [Propylenella binzhouense]|uniref:SDR family oxidoreductase n=1 Tax=Propylenella binzhouense TaxID=2555902 RepID=A0A964T941_9HYPH|nr:SDR family oxidoreductase [Propylenella binzhouense]MYZ50147.1 SDR family oxidoreductase [Propylenella binzhouense]
MPGEGSARELEGRVALVTGSARNIGRAIALALADGGAAVAVHARSSEAAAKSVVAEIEARGGRAAWFLAELTDPQAVRRLFDDVRGTFGRLDILVNNAASRADAPIERISLEEWRAITAGILDTAFLCCQAAIPLLAESGRGAIVSIGGVAAHCAIGGRSHVVAAKSGIAGLTRGLSVELADRNITVNIVSPGYINTKRDHIPPHFQDRKVPLGRPGEPEEIAAAVRFLCGPGARYVTGQAIQVAGGWA